MGSSHEPIKYSGKNAWKKKNSLFTIFAIDWTNIFYQNKKAQQD